jgi:hypothetical protein
MGKSKGFQENVGIFYTRVGKLTGGGSSAEICLVRKLKEAIIGYRGVMVWWIIASK